MMLGLLSKVLIFKFSGKFESAHKAAQMKQSLICSALKHAYVHLADVSALQSFKEKGTRCQPKSN